MPLDRRKTVVLESIRRFLRKSAPGHLANLLTKIRPQDFPAIYAELTERERVALFKQLGERDHEGAALLLVELPPGEAVDVLSHLPVPHAAKLLEECSGDDAAELLSRMDPARSEELLRAMEPEDKAAVEQLLIYEEETAGRIMTPEVFALPEETTVAEAVSSVQARGEDVETVFYLYVTDERNHLVGVLSLRELLIHPPHMKLKEFMNQDLITVRTDADQEEVARIASKYDLLAVPVTDDRGRLVGLITIDDVIDVLREEATEDIYALAGTSAEERIEPSVMKSARIRSPWLLASAIGGLLAMIVIRKFDASLAQVVGLAALLPVVNGTGGAAGNQSAIVIIRGLATGRIDSGQYLHSFMREMGVSAILGALYGVLVGAATFGYSLVFGADGLVSATMAARYGNGAMLMSSAIIAVSLLLAMLFSTLMGSMTPILLHRAGIDPAVSTTPFVTTSTDIIGSATFLTLASFLLFV